MEKIERIMINRLNVKMIIWKLLDHLRYQFYFLLLGPEQKITLLEIVVAASKIIEQTSKNN